MATPPLHHPTPTQDVVVLSRSRLVSGTCASCYAQQLACGTLQPHGLDPTPSTARAVNSLDALPKASDDPTLGESFLSSFHDRSTSSSAVPLRRKNTACGTAVSLQWERSRREVDLAASHRLTTSAVSLAIAKEEGEARGVPSCYITS